MNQHLPIPKIFSSIEEVAHELQQMRGCFLLYDENVPRGIQKQIEMACQPKSVFSVRGGDGIKSLSHYEQVITWLMESYATSSDHLVVLGGGSASDLGGFVAATYHRGMSLTLIPTTLLSMTDAAIGGKNGLNVLGVKNAIGTIYQPEAILICPEFLSDDILVGMPEMIKHAILDDCLEIVEEFFQTGELLPLIQHSVQFKTKVVGESKQRHILNLGHTIGHAIEGVLGPKCMHGAAVFLGLIGECSINGASLDIVERLEKLPLHSIVPDISQITFEALFDKMLQDKKSRSGMVGIVSLKTMNIEYVDKSILETAWRRCCAYANRC